MQISKVSRLRKRLLKNRTCPQRHCLYANWIGQVMSRIKSIKSQSLCCWSHCINGRMFKTYTVYTTLFQFQYHHQPCQRHQHETLDKSTAPRRLHHQAANSIPTTKRRWSPYAEQGNRYILKYWEMRNKSKLKEEFFKKIYHTHKHTFIWLCKRTVNEKALRGDANIARWL